VIKRIVFFGLVAGLLLALTVPASAKTDNRTDSGPHGRAVIYVESQDLYFDSIVLGDLPQKGRFQKLEIGPDGLHTVFGPGDVGYIGGRWWLDVNGNGVQDDGDAFFLCPLLGPGRSMP
jgi:hypothetical protein